MKQGPLKEEVFFDLSQSKRVMAIPSFSLVRFYYTHPLYPVTGRSFLPQEATFYHRKKYPTTGRDFLPQEGISCHRKKIPVKERNFWPHKDIFASPGANFV